jgi:uncharacterized coiled-coil protein SlyX
MNVPASPIITLSLTEIVGILALVIAVIAGVLAMRKSPNPLAPDVSWAEQDKQVKFLIDQLAKANKKIEELEAKIRALECELQRIQDTIPRGEAMPLKPLLLICGTEEAIYQADRQAIRRTGIKFHRLTGATKASVSGELRRRRQDKTLYPWIHVSSHSGPEGVVLCDGVANPEWWNEQLDGISVIFLAGCSSVEIADHIAGLVDHVIVTYEKIKNEDAADFTYSFWKGMEELGDANRAFEQALNQVPQVAEFVDIR